MQPFKQLISDLFRFMISNRQAGTTTAIKRISDEHDVYVLVPTKECGKIFGKNHITFLELSHSYGKSPKPVLVDNSAMISLLELVEYNRVDLQNMIDSRQALIDDIEDKIKNFKLRVK